MIHSMIQMLQKRSRMIARLQERSRYKWISASTLTMAGCKSLFDSDSTTDIWHNVSGYQLFKPSQSAVQTWCSGCSSVNSSSGFWDCRVYYLVLSIDWSLIEDGMLAPINVAFTAVIFYEISNDLWGATSYRQHKVIRPCVVVSGW